MTFLTDNSDYYLMNATEQTWRFMNIFDGCLPWGSATTVTYSVLMSLFLLLMGCTTPISDPIQDPEGSVWADSLLGVLSLESKVAQMIMVDFPTTGDITNEDDRAAFLEHILAGRAGGMVLFAGDPLAYAPWIEWAQHESRIPGMIALDAEWGSGYRLENMTRFPDAMAIAASGRAELAYDVGLETAFQASLVGVSVLFAPVLDVLTNPKNPVIGTRAYSDHPDTVALYAGAFVRGVRERGLLSVAKHFPGHGDTSTDSHTDLTVSDRSETDFFDIDLRPYKLLIQDSLDAIMSAHIVPKRHSYADSLPATLSHRILSDLARDSLHFNGIVFSDALNMTGVTAIGPPGDVAVRAVQAGVDVLLMPPDPKAALNAVVLAVREGAISEARIDSSVRRILRAKQSLQLHTSQQFTDMKTLLQVSTSEDTKNIGWFAGRASVTVLKNDSIVPVALNGKSLVLISLDFRTYPSTEKDPATKLYDALRSRSGTPVSHIRLSPSSWQNAMVNVSRAAKGDVDVIFADFVGTTPVRGWNRLEFLTQLELINHSVVVLEHASPFTAIQTPSSIPGHIVAYDSSPAMIMATADVLFGLSASKGRLPVHVSESYPRGYGVFIPQYFASLTTATSATMDAEALQPLDELLDVAVSEGAFPAAALVVGRGNHIVKRSDFGRFTYDSDRLLNENDEFDLASLTKVIATTTAIMQLVEAGKIDLNRPVADYLPEFGQNGKGAVTIWDLLTHTGGLIPFRPFHTEGVRSASELRNRILEDSLTYEPGTKSSYSDFGLIALAWMVERLTGELFDSYTKTHIFEPLTMNSTGYKRVGDGIVSNAVPTEIDDYFRHRTLQGEVHDETAFILGGTAGHAGLFSTADDLAKFAAMLANDGRIGDRVFLKPATIRRFTTKVDPFGDHTRALGWDTKSMSGYSSAGSGFGPLSFGHTGFTGTSLWVDPDTDMFVILLTNRVYPTRDNRALTPIRPAVANVAFSALRTGFENLHALSE